MKKPIALIIRDGWGFNPRSDYNAIRNATIPNHDNYSANYPTALIGASGVEVGLPEGNQGSSEVGHLNMGAGRVVYQTLVRINLSIQEGEFYQNDVIVHEMERIRQTGSTLHLMGLIQDQGVHAHTDHLLALIKMAKTADLQPRKVKIHIFSDGRDTPPNSTKTYIQPILDFIDQVGIGQIATISGRYFGMDRDNRWDRVESAYNLLVDAKSNRPLFEHVFQAVDDAYQAGETDEFIKPRVMLNYDGIHDQDGIIFFNYRMDRTRELTRAFVEDGFNHFPLKSLPHLHYLCMTEYYEGVAASQRTNVKIVFPPITMDHLFGQVVADAGLKQLRIAETEKYAHVTFFFNGQSDIVFPNEVRMVIPSPKVATYDLQPEMSAFEVKDKVISLIREDLYDVVILNFANPDMVGHTGVYNAAVKAIETVDQCVGQVIDEILKHDGIVFLTSDHGNAEQMIDYQTGVPHTAHTTNQVWLHIISHHPYLQKNRIRIKSHGRLADIVPTMLSLMNIDIPPSMNGTILIESLK